MAVTLDIDLKVNTSEAMQTVSDFKKDIDNKFQDIDILQNSASKITQAAESILPSLSQDDPFRGFASSARAASDALSQMQRTLNVFSSVMGSGKISDGMTRMFEASYRTMLSSMMSIQESMKKSFHESKTGSVLFNNAAKVAEQETGLRVATATGKSASADMIRLMKIIRNNETGLSASQFGSLVPALNSIVRFEVDEYRRSTRSTPTLNELAKYVSGSDVFSKTAKGGISNYGPSEKQLESLAKSLIISQRSNSYRDNNDIIHQAGIKQKEWQFVVDQLPLISGYAKDDRRSKGLREAFLNYGTQLKQQTYQNESVSANRSVYGAFRRLVRNGNQQAIRYGLDTGLLTAENGRYLFSGSANMAQMNRMAGLAARTVHEAKSSLPYYYTDPTGSLDTEKLLMRQNNAFNDALEVMEVLSKQAGLTPDVNGHDAALLHFSRSGKQYKKFNSKSPKIKTLGTNNQFVIPKTVLNANGQLEWRDPSWRKENGVEEKEEDQFATIGESAFTYLLGMNGNNTYGYGRDESGRAIYGAPKAIRLNTSHLYKQVDTKEGSRMIVDPEKEAEAREIEKIFARKKTLKYGAPGSKKQDEYIAAFGDAGSITLIRKGSDSGLDANGNYEEGTYSGIVRKFADLGMANPFDNMNTGGLFRSGDYENASKMIDLSRKKATPGQQYSKLGYTGTPKMAMVDFEQLYNYLGISEANSKMRENQRIDGVNFFDPSVLGINAQMRSGVVGKFMGQAMDWRKLLAGSGLLEEAYNQSRNSKTNMGLLVKNDNNTINGFGKAQSGYSFYMPQIGLKSVRADWLNKALGRNTNEDILLQDIVENGKVVTPGLISEMNRLQGIVEDKNSKSADVKNAQDLLDQIRNTYFFDIMDKNYKALITESTIKNNDKFRIISKKAFEQNNVTGKKGLFFGEKWARDLGNGTVELTADQQRRYFEKATDMTGGLWVSRTGYDFRTDKDYIPESLAAAIGADVGPLKEQSIKNYDEYLSKMRTDKNARIKFLNSTSMGRRLIESGQWDTEQANRLIQAHINDVESKKGKGDLFLPEMGVDNLLTGVMPGSVFGNIFESAFGIRVKDNNKYRRLFNYSDDQDRVFMKTVGDAAGQTIRRNAQIAKLMLSRMPAAPGEYSVGTQNIGNTRAIQRAMDAIGADYDDTIFTDPTLQYTLMTGDYDGDTAWVVRGLSGDAFNKMQAIQDYIQKAREQIQEKIKTTSSKKEKRILQDNLKAFTNFGADHFTAQIGMGQSTAAIRNALTSLSDDDPDKWLAIAEAIDAYDRQTSEAMKEGEIVKLGTHADKYAKEGALFRRFVKEINAYANDSENAKPSLFSTRLPEIQDVATLMGMVSNFNNKRKGESVGDLFNRGLDRWLFEQYGYSDSYEAQAARHYGGMFKNIQGGIRLANLEDITNGRLIAVNWQRDLDRRRKAGETGTDFEEEQRQLNAYARRLKQAEESGSLYEDYQKEIFRLENKRDSLIRNGQALDSKEILGLDKKLEQYRALTAPMTQPFETARAEMLKKAQNDEEAVKTKIAENQKWAASHGINLDVDYAALLDPMLSRDQKDTSVLNWSDNAPWMYEVLKEKNFKLTGIRESSLTRRNKDGSRVTDPIKKEGTFKPWPHEDWKILDQKSEILAKEMDTQESLIPRFTDSASALMGTLRHETFASVIEALARGDRSRNVTDVYEETLNAVNKKIGSTGTRFKALGLDFTVDKNGRYILSGASDNVTEGVNAALGAFIPNQNGKGGKYVGGTLEAFINDVVLANGAQVANIEGYNLNSRGFRVNNKTEDYTGRGTLFSREITGPNGEKIRKEGTFAPDLIMRNQNGSFSMYDYKSGEQGAYDSLFQMAIYAKDIQNKVRNGDKKAMKRLGWDKYVDDQGNLKIKELNAYDTATGTMLSWDVDQKIIDDLDAMHGEALSRHAFGSEADRVKAVEKLKAAAALKYGARVQATKVQTNEELVKSLNLGDITGKGDWYEDYVAQKFAKDQETFQEINSLAYKTTQRFGNEPVRGYSQYAAARRNLEATLDDDVLNVLQTQAEKETDPGKKASAIATIQKLQSDKQFARSNLNQAELLAVKNGFGDIESYMLEQFFGVKKNSAASAYESVLSRIQNKAAEREGLLENKEAFQNGQWTEYGKRMEYDKIYDQSIKDEQNVRAMFKTLLPEMQRQTIQSNNDTLTSLLSENKEDTPEQKIQEYYNNKYKAIENYIKQQQSDIQSFNKLLDQTDKQGNLVLSKGSEERKFFEDLKANSLDNQNTALNTLKDKYSIRAAAQREHEQSIGLFNGDKKKSRADLQKEYLKSVEDEYATAKQLADPKTISRMKGWATRYGNQGDTKRQQAYLEEIADREARFNAAQAKMDELSEMRRRMGMTEETERIQKELDAISVQRLYAGNSGLSKDEQIKRAYLSKTLAANQYRATLSEADLLDFDRKFTPQALQREAEREVNESIDLQWIARQQQEDRLQHQNEMATEQRRHQYEQMRRNRFGYSRSRIGNAYRQQLDRKWSLDQQVKNNEFYAKQAEESIKLQKDAFEAKYKISYADFQKLTPEAQKAMGGEVITDAGKISSAQKQMEGYANAAKDAADQSEQMTGASMAMSAAFQGLSQSLSMVAHRLGRQLFMKALQETKRFVKEFDASMTEIQAITLKSDQEMQGIRSQTINKALGLRTSVSNVSNVEAALYRQGLSDQEVSARTESIIKFATVTKLKVEDATKIITTALQNDLVASANEAMDALVALGDSAATTAAEIGKGMQKAAAAAKVAGVSYSELTALLTIGTSDTQLSGTQVGTALQTVFTRMRRLSTTGWAADQNGEKTTANDAEAALKAVGVDLWDDKAVGKMRSAYDVLRDLSKVWQNLSDAQKNIVMNSMAGTRQTNVFATLMEGMSENNGETLEKYLGLAEGSEGVTQSKYEIAMQSLAASMDTLKSSWDAVVESFVSSGSITGILDSVSGFLQGIANSSDIGKGFGVVTGGIAALVTALLTLKSANPIIAALSGLFALVAGVGAGGLITSLFGKPETDEDKMNNAIELTKGNIEGRSAVSSKQNSLIDSVKKSGERYDNAFKSDNIAEQAIATTELTKALEDLAVAFPTVSDEIQKSINNLQNWGKAVDEAQNVADNFVTESKRKSLDESFNNLSNYFATEYEKQSSYKVSAQKTARALEYIDRAGLGRFSKSEDLLAGFVSQYIVAQADAERGGENSKAFIDTVDYVFTQLGYGDTILKKLKNKDTTGYDADQVANAFGDVVTYLNSDTAKSNTSKMIAGRADMQNVIRTFIDSSLFTESGISGDKILNAYLSWLNEEMVQNPTVYYDEDGNVNWQEILNHYAVNLKNPYYNLENSDQRQKWIKDFIQTRSSYTNYNFHYNENDPNTWFDDYNEAIEYGSKHGLDLTTLKTSNGSSAYQGFEALFEARNIEANANNVNDVIDEILHGSKIDISKIGEDYQKKIAHVYAASKNANEEEILNKIKSGEITYNNLSPLLQNMVSGIPSLGVKGLSEYPDLQSLYQAYNTAGKSSVLANFVANNANAASAVLMGDMDMFTKAVQEAEQGMSTTSSRADMMKIFGTAFQTGEATNRAKAVKLFRTNGLTSKAYETWQSFFGENADAILKAMASEEGLTGDLLDYYNRTLAEKGIAIGTGKQFTNVQTSRLARTVFDIGDWTKAQETSTARGWTTDEWSALENKYPELRRYLQMTPDQRASQEGQNLERNIRIQMSVSGVSDLEEANKILQGTTSLIENLQKGGEIALRASIDYDKNFNSKMQDLAILTSGTREEQIALLRSKGYEDYDIEHNMNDIINQERQVAEENVNNVNARSLDEIAKSGQVGEAIRLANEHGYQYYVTSGENYEDEYHFFRSSNAETPNVKRSNPALNLSQTFTAKELADARKQITANMFERTTENENLYQAAFSSLGTYGRQAEYERLNGGITETTRRLAEAENAELEREAQEREALEKARLNASSVGGALSYANLRYEQGNRPAIAADEIYRTLTGGNISTVEDLSRAVNDSDIQNWKDLLESSEDVRKAFEDVGAKVNDDGTIDFSGVESSAGSLTNALDVLTLAVANASKSYNQQVEVLSQGEIYNRAAEYLAGEGVAESGFDAYSQIIGNTNLANIVKNNRIAYDAEKEAFNDYWAMTDAERTEYLRTHNNIAPKGVSAEFNPYEGLEGYDLEYAKQLEENAKYGQAGLTDINRINFFEQLLKDARNGNLTNIREADKTGFYSDVTGVVSGGSNYLQMVETLQKKGLDYTDFADIEEGSDAYQQLQEAFESTGHTAEEFLESQKQIDTELKSASIVALRTYGKESEKVADTYKKLNGTVEEQLSAQKQMNKNRIALGNATYYTSGKGSKDYSKVAKEFLGYSKEDVAALEKSLGKDKAKLQIQQEAELQLSVDRQQVINDANAVIQNAIDEIGGVKYEDIKFLIGGTYDISQLSQMAEGLTGDAKTIIDALLTQLANMEGSVTFGGSADVNGDTGTLTVSSKNIKTSGGGFKTGGGGGGGKSATDKLLENQKRKLAELEHQQKMLEIAEKGLDFSNDYSGWNTNLDEQIVVQEKLRAQYAANIKEMDDMLKKVKQGSDDWYKLKEAIMSAEEAMASVSNTINELNEKRISILSQEQENADKPAAHALSMQQKYAARYQKSDQFEGYVAMTELTIETTRKQIEQNNSQITDWENLLLEFEENSDSWIETRDNIWKLREENADLENQVASDMIDLQEAKIAQIAKDLENAQSPYQHAVNMLETYGGMYQSMNNQGAYRGTLQDTIANNNQLKALNDAAIEELKKQIEGMQESDPARQSAISTLYQLEEASAKYEASMLANQQAIEESLISELKTTYSDSGSILEHELKLLSEAEKEFLRDDDFVNYENILQEETRNASERIKLQKQALEDYLALQNSGQITEGSQQWKDLEETIRTAEESIASYSNEYEDLIDKLQNVKFENLQKTFNEADELAQHNLKMIQYEETRYQNRGELSNYGILLARDTEMQTNRADEISGYIANLKDMQETAKDNPALYKKITQEIYKWEEQLSSINNTIEKNEELLHKNEEAIRKVRKAVEDTVDKEIRARIQKARDMLAATVQVENSILEVIRRNYQEQWRIQKTDLDKKKQALNEEKNLINERLNARKEAINQEEKYEELAQLRTQYALISADTTRTKDANELREKIKDLQQEISWDIAEDEASAATQAIDDQVRAIDNYVSTYEEDLSEMLSDSNNFRDDLNTIMGGSFEDFLGWMQENNESYKLATADARATMEQGWEDTWKKMKGEIDTYWNEVDESMRSREGFLAYMQNSDTYKTASQTGQQSLLSYWGDMYDDYTASLINDANFDHTHEILDKVDELKDWTFNVRISELDGYDINPWSDYVYNRRTDYDPYVDDDDYSGRGKQPEPAPTPEPTPAPSGGRKKDESSYTATVWYATGSGYIDKVTATGKTYDLAEKAAYKAVPRVAMYAHNKKSYVEKYVEDLGKRKSADILTAASAPAKFAEGGLVDFTGPAWVDGTKTKPESFLDSTDTALLRSMLDAFTYVRNTPYMSHVSSDMFGRPNVSIGDVNVNLYEAKLEDDADYNKIATKVGEVFTKELQKNGMNIANYSW